MPDSLAEALTIPLPRIFRLSPTRVAEKSLMANALQELLLRFKPVPLRLPPDLAAIARRVVDASNSGRLNEVGFRDFRFSAQALFAGPNLANNDAFLRTYLTEVRRRAATDLPGGRGTLRLLMTMYLVNFSGDSEACRRICALLSRTTDSLSRLWQLRILDGQLLEMKTGPLHAGQRLIAAENLEIERARLGLHGALSSCAFVQASILAVSASLTSAFRKGQRPSNWDRFVALVAPGGRIDEVHREAALRAFLDPFVGGVNPTGLREQVKPILLASFGDPRVDTSRWPTLAGKDGALDRDNYLSVVRRWLVSETIDLFFDIIDKHGLDHQWRTRKAFWKQYFDNETVSDAWVAFATRPHKTARRINSVGVEGATLEWGRLLDAGDPDHAVLLMQMGDITVAEWSHNGKVRLWRREDKQSPALYVRQYRKVDFRMRPAFETSHLPPDGWQQKVDVELRRYGIRPGKRR